MADKENIRNRIFCDLLYIHREQIRIPRLIYTTDGI